MVSAGEDRPIWGVWHRKNAGTWAELVSGTVAQSVWLSGLYFDVIVWAAGSFTRSTRLALEMVEHFRP